MPLATVAYLKMADNANHMTDNNNHMENEPSVKAKAKADKMKAKAEAKAKRTEEKAKAKAEKESVKTLAEMAEAIMLADIKASVDKLARSTTFACGGNVPFKVANETDVVPDKDEAVQAGINPIQIRFGESGEGITVYFPEGTNASKQLQELIAACQPASFGRGGEAILDENYRRAVKLDTEDFATTFCPYEACIIDVVAQLLLPQIKHDKHLRSIRVSTVRVLSSSRIMFADYLQLGGAL